MASIRIEPNCRHYYVIYRDPGGNRQHVNSLIEHTPEGGKQNAKRNREAVASMAENIEAYVTRQKEGKTAPISAVTMQ